MIMPRMNKFKMKKIKPFIPFIVVFFVSDIIRTMPFVLHHYIPIPEWLATWLSIFLLLLLPVSLTIWYVKKNGCEEFLFSRNSFIFLLITLIFTFSYIFLFDSINNHISNQEIALENNHIFYKITNLEPDAMTILMICRNLICAPVFETILIIALFQKPLEKLTSPYVALIISVLIFTALHFGQGYMGMLSAFFSGMIFGFCYLKTKNLAIPIICHFSVNIIGNILIVNILNKGNIVLLIIFSICFIASFIYLLRYNEKPSYSCEE